MSGTCFLKTRVSCETKRLIERAAAREYLTEAAWLRHALEKALGEAATGSPAWGASIFTDGRSRARGCGGRARLYIEMKPQDRDLLRDRAAARGMPAATYASVLLRSHLRRLAPLPRAELASLKDCVSELGAIGRNLNQIARAVNSSSRTIGPSRGDLAALLRVCESLREHVKALLAANLRSWALSDAEDEHPSARR